MSRTPHSSPHMWIFPKIQTVDGYLEPRIMRLDTEARQSFVAKFTGDARFNPYLWPLYFPQDTVYLDKQQDDVIVMSGDIDYSYSDELAGIRIAKCSFDFNDKSGYSGKDGDGNLIPFQDLFASGTTLYNLILNDKSETSNYIFCTTLYRSHQNVGDYAVDQFGIPVTFLKITFIGDIDKNTMPDTPLLIRNDEVKTEFLRTATIRMNCFPCWDRALKYKMRDLIWNHFQDGNTSIQKSDTDAFGSRPSHPNNVAFIAGFKTKNTIINVGQLIGANVQINEFVAASGFDKSGANPNIPDNYNIVSALLSTDGFGVGSQDWVTTENYTSWRVFTQQSSNSTHGNTGDQSAFGNSSFVNGSGNGVTQGYNQPGLFTLWNCHTDSFRNGWYGISLNTIIRKIAAWVGCDPDILATFDQTMVGGNAKFNDVNSGYDCVPACVTFSMSQNASSVVNMNFVVNWNGLVGLDPRGQGIFQTSQSQEIGSNGCIRASVLFMEDGKPKGQMYYYQNQITLVDGQQVFVEGIKDLIDPVTNPTGGGIFTVANVTTYINLQKFWQQDFDLVGSQYKADSHFTGTMNQFFTTPVTYAENDHFDIFIKNILWQFGFKLKFSITQGGESIGMPVMNFVSRWKQGKAIPISWKVGKNGMSRQPRKITSDCIRVSQIGDSGYCISPPNGKLPPLEIPALRWRTRQYGVTKGVYPPNLVYDSASGKNLFSQNDVAYSYTIFGDNDSQNIALYGYPLSENNGWIPCAYLYEPYIDAASSNPRFPSVWKSWCDVNAPYPSSDWSGHYALQCLMWSPSASLFGAPGNLHPLPNQYNPMFDVARLAAMEFVNSREMYVRDFLGLTYLDNPDDEYEDSWQEGGKMVGYKMYNRSYNQISGELISSEWVASPVNGDYSDLSSAPSVVFFGGASVGTGGSSSSSTGSSSVNNSTTTTNTNDTYKFPTRTLKLYSGGVVLKTLTAMTFERYDSVNKRTVAQYAFPVEYAAQGFETYGLDIFAFLRYKGTEHGNCEVVGVSAPGVPDYWFSGFVSEKRQITDDTNVNYFPQGLMWSEDKGSLLLQRILEVANPNRRMYFGGRIKAQRHSGVFDNLSWVSLTNPVFPLSNDEITNDSDLGIIGASRLLPSLAGHANSIDVVWNSRVQPVALHGSAVVEYIVAKSSWQIGLNPVMNQIVNGSPNVNGCSFNFWMNDATPVAAPASLPGQFHTLIASAIDLDTYPSTNWYIDIWGTCHIIGDNAFIQ